MTTISAKVVEDSVSSDDVRLTTLQLRYPKWIHGEFMTHRQFSRNASSSRAIPVSRLIQDVEDDPALPLIWTRNEPGMQGTKLLEGRPLAHARRAMEDAMWQALSTAQYLADLGAHKQLVNRVLEPFCHIEVVVSATEWSNFEALRCHPAAEPHMRMLAEAIRDARAASTPRVTLRTEWHLPYITREERASATYADKADMVLVKLSAARCARVSYLTHDGLTPDPDADLRLYDRLASARPIHASPLEHQATPDRWNPGAYHGVGAWERPNLHGNFRGWIQHRKTLPNECL